MSNILVSTDVCSSKDTCGDDVIDQTDGDSTERKPSSENRSDAVGDTSSTTSALETSVTTDVEIKDTRNARTEEANINQDGGTITPVPKTGTSTKEVCKNHSEKVIEFYCVKHEFFGCSVCMVNEHKKCKGVAKLSDISSDVDRSTEYQDFRSNLSNVVTMADGVISKSKRNSALVGQRRDYFIERLNKARRDMNATFDKMEKDLKDETYMILQKDIKAIYTTVQTCKDIKNNVQEMISYLDLLEKTEQSEDMFIAMKMEKQHVMMKREKITNVKEMNEISTYKFQPSTQLQSLLSGSVDIASVTAIAPKTAFVTCLPDMRVRTEKDTEVCNVTAAVALDNQRLAVIDSGNRKLKLLDATRNEVVSEMPIRSIAYDSKLHGIAKVDHMLALTIPSERKIALMEVKNDDLAIVQEIATEMECFQIAPISNKIVVSAYFPTRLDFLDLGGNSTDSVSLDNDDFEEVSGIAVSPDCGNVFFINPSNSKVIALSSWRQPTKTYTSWFLGGSGGLACDHSGLVYVAGIETNNVHQITADCSKVRILLSKGDGIVAPQALCCCDVTDRFYVSLKDSDVIKVFKMG